jgi:hypothetical protein
VRRILNLHPSGALRVVLGKISVVSVDKIHTVTCSGPLSWLLDITGYLIGEHPPETFVADRGKNVSVDAYL